MNFPDPAGRAGLLVWVVCLLLAFPLFFYVAAHPEFMLWVEENQPALGVDRGLELVKQGNIPEALRAVQGAVRSFGELVREKGLERHKIQLARALIVLTDLYTDYGSPEQKAEILPLRQKAVEAAPDYSYGLPYLKLGLCLLDQKDYQQAAEAFSQVLTRRAAPLCLEAQFRRGQAYFLLAQPEQAARDWLDVVRYSPSVSPQQWQAMLALPPCIGPDCQLLQGVLSQHQGRSSEALEFVRAYLRNDPSDRYANHLLSVLASSPVNASPAPIPLSDCYPPAPLGGEYIIQIAHVNLFSDRGGPCLLRLNLSGTSSGSDFPELSVRLGRQEHEILVSSDASAMYDRRLELQPGRNLLTLRVKVPPASLPPPRVTLHSLALLPDANS